MDQHRAVDLGENREADLDDEIRPDSQDVLVERRVVEFAEGETIPDRGLTSPGIGQDVCGVEQLSMTQAAHRARLAIGAYDSLPKARLMKSTKLHLRRIPPSRILSNARARGAK